MTRIYIAGPMTGFADFNYPAFNAKAAELRSEGFEVFNPAELPAHEGKTYEQYMCEAMLLLLKCDAVYLLPGWAKSRGAQFELQTARILRMAVIYGGRE